MTLRPTIIAFLPLAAIAAAAQGKPSAAIPATPVTTIAAPQSGYSQPSRPASPSRRATVTWIEGTLTIEAQNSSLNTILRDISLKTGMKIVGGVQDERVFGKYGPGTAAAVIGQLMDGTKCNVLLQSDTANLPVQLTLTPVTGGVTPPNPMQIADEAQEQQPPVQPATNQIAPPVQSQRQTVDQPALPPPPTTDNQHPADAAPATTTQESPNGVRTPEQIFQQLQDLRKRQQQQQTTQ